MIGELMARTGKGMKVQSSYTIEPELLEWAQKHLPAGEGGISGFISQVLRNYRGIVEWMAGLRYAILQVEYEKTTEQIKLLQKMRRKIADEMDMLDLERKDERPVRSISRLEMEVIKIASEIDEHRQPNSDILVFPPRPYQMMVEIDKYKENKARQLGVSKEQLEAMLKQVMV